MLRFACQIGLLPLVLYVADPLEAGDRAARRADPLQARAVVVQGRHTASLLKMDGVIGTAIGEAKRSPVIKVYTARPGVPGLPADLEGVPVKVEEIGDLYAGPPPDNIPVPEEPGAVEETRKTHRPNPRKHFERPVPIGVSTGNEGQCSAGTIGCRVRNPAGELFALSNNHVFALQNNAPLGSTILQPGRYDVILCGGAKKNGIGELAQFKLLFFGAGSTNTIDAALASITDETCGNATPADGYGLPKSTVVEAVLGDSVQKYGRTTRLRTGLIDGLNATITVRYLNAKTQFTGQIVIRSKPKAFIRAGDSGSLVVTNPGRNPVGLVFAGNLTGKVAIANPIQPVLDEFGVTIDGEP